MYLIVLTDVRVYPALDVRSVSRREGRRGNWPPMAVRESLAAVGARLAAAAGLLAAAAAALLEDAAAQAHLGLGLGGLGRIFD